MTPDSDLPPIGAHVHVHRGVTDTFQPAIVVAHVTDRDEGLVLELRLSNLQRIQRAWPSAQVRLDPA